MLTVGSLFAGRLLMPSGGTPKVYAPDVVARVAGLYAGGKTQCEIAALIGASQKVVWNVMRRHGIGARIAAKRNQSGANNAYWKGDAATYEALHKRVEVARGRPAKCDQCGTVESKHYDWANLTGNYADVNDYKRMCRSCHWKFDRKIENIRKGRLQNAC